MLPLPLSALHSTLPVFKNPANMHRAVSLTAEQFRYSFGNAVSQEESDDAVRAVDHPVAGQARCSRPRRRTSRCTRRPRSNTGNEDRGPLLLIAGGQDHTVPEVITKATAKQYRHSTAVTDLIEFPDRGHSLTIDSGWREVADDRRCHGWQSRGSDRMLALRAHRRGGPEQLVVEEAPVPVPAAGEVLVAVHAAAITLTELRWDLSWQTRDGADRTPVIPSHEVSGVVAGLGAGVTGLAAGDEVYGLVDFDRNGAAAEFVTVPASALAAKPAKVVARRGGRVAAGRADRVAGAGRPRAPAAGRAGAGARRSGRRRGVRRPARGRRSART